MLISVHQYPLLNNISWIIVVFYPKPIYTYYTYRNLYFLHSYLIWLTKAKGVDFCNILCQLRLEDHRLSTSTLEIVVVSQIISLNSVNHPNFVVIETTVPFCGSNDAGGCLVVVNGCCFFWIYPICQFLSHLSCIDSCSWRGSLTGTNALESFWISFFNLS